MYTSYPIAPNNIGSAQEKKQTKGQKKNTFCLVGIFCLSFLFWNSSVMTMEIGHDGSVSYNVSIKAPAVENGSQPQLAIDYNFNSPNGVSGFGFHLKGISATTRINNERSIRYGQHDTYIGPKRKLSGKLYLVDANNATYHAEQKDWVEFVPYGSDDAIWIAAVNSNGCGNAPCYWKAYTTDGKILNVFLTLSLILTL